MSNGINTVQIKRLLISQSLFWSAQSLFDIFLSVYIWKFTNSLVDVAIFKLFYIVTHGIFFTLFGFLVKKGKLHFSRNLGLIGLTLTYFILFLLKEKSLDYIIPMAICIGMFNGMYWVSYHIFRFDFTNKNNRGNFAGTEKATRIFLNLIVPILGGFIIYSDFFGLGYANLFIIGSLLYLLSYTFADKNHTMHSKSKMHLKKTIRELLKDKNIIKSLGASLFGGFGRAGALSKVILPLYIFSVLGNELSLGGWLSFFSLAAIITSLFIGKLDYKHYRSVFTFGGLSFFTITSLLIAIPSFLTYVIFGVFKGILEVFMFIPKRVISDNLLHNIENYSYHRVEFIVVREWFNVVIGRGISYTLLIFVGDINSGSMMCVLGIMAIAILLETYMLRSINTEKIFQE